MRDHRYPFIKLLAVAIVAIYIGSIIVNPDHISADRGKDERASLIESSQFTRADFFGAKALVPYPTAEARNRLADLEKRYPEEPEVLLKLAQLDEKLGNLDQAEKELRRYVELGQGSLRSLETLCEFFQRRAQ